MEIKLYTDGSGWNCHPKRPGGWAALILQEFSRKGLMLSGNNWDTSNNPMEMRAIIEGLTESLQITRDSLVDCITVWSDSEYCVKGINEWFSRWRQNEWKTSAGKPVKDKEEWIRLKQIVDSSTVPISFKHIRAHSGIKWNELVDKEARRCMQCLSKLNMPCFTLKHRKSIIAEGSPLFTKRLI